MPRRPERYLSPSHRVSQTEHDLNVARGWFRAAVLTLVLACAARGQLRAQSLTSGSLGGGVMDRLGTALGEADVVLTDRLTGVTRAALTRRNGQFRFLLVPPGEYDLRVERLGYRPRVIIQVPVRAGSALQTVVRLDALQGESGVDTVPFGGAPTGASALVFGAGSAAADFADLADSRGSLAAATAILPGASAELESEGLPGRMAVLALDAVPRDAARHPRLGGGAIDAVTFPLVAAGTAELLAGATDAEWPGASGGVVATTSRRGARNLRIDAGMDAGTGEQRGHVVLSGPVVRDTAHFVIGAAFRRVQPSLDPAWTRDSVADSVLVIARDSFNTDLSAYARAWEPSLMVATAFGRFDWRLTDDHHLVVRASAGAGTWDDADPGVQGPALGTSLALQDISTGAILTSQLSSALAQEVRFSVDASSRETDLAGLPRATLAEGGFAWGGGDLAPGRFSRTAVTGSETMHIRLGGGAEMKAGFVLRSMSYGQTWGDDRGGVYSFGGWTDLAARSGAYRRATGTLPVSNFRTTDVSFFTQMLLRPTPALELTAGLRVGREKLPVGAARRNATWLQRTGLDNALLVQPGASASPRAAFQWTAGAGGEWRIRGEAALARDAFDPGLLAEWIGRSLGGTMERSAGTLGTWPDIPDTMATAQGQILTLFGPQFEAPRTGRVAFGITRGFGGAVLRVSGAYRHTDFLPRRRDLNLTATPSTRDGEGRIIYGTLLQTGSLVTAQPGSNRRFNGFDEVIAVDASAASDYYGLTVGLERLPEHGLALLLSWTVSRTTDTWVGAGTGTADAMLAPFDSIGGQEWSDARSDFDVPQRIVAGMEFRGRGRFGLRLGALVRWQSGLPFTPGYRDGVDVNADGSGRNDPAFVSDTVAGAIDVIAANGCLSSQLSRFAARNSCRGPSLLRVDLRFGFTLVRTGSTTTELLVDALDVAGSDDGVVDRALYLVDPARTITTTAVGRVVVPLVANPNFGRLLLRRAAGATVRAGLRVRF